jgi:methionyl-tRNA formyltransferase
MKPRVVLVGRTSLLRSCIKTIVQTGAAEVSLVLMRHDLSELDNSLLQYCKRNSVPVLLYLALSSDEVIAELQRIRPAILLSMYNAEVLRSPLLEAVGLAVNFHDGPLPRYAGLNPAAWALLNNEPRHGVTWHLITPEIDAGHIISQEMFDIQKAWSVLDLISACMRQGSDLFRLMLPRLLDRSYSLQPQDLSKRTYFSRASRPFGGTVPLSSGAEQLARLARATSYFPFRNSFARPFISIDGRTIELLRFRVLPDGADRAPGTFMSVEGSSAAFAISGGKLVVDLAQTPEDGAVTGSVLALRHQLGRHSAAGDIVLN